MLKLLNYLFLFILVLVFFLESTYASPSQFTLQGQIINPNQTQLEKPSVDFTVQIYSPAPDSCLLYEEHFLNVNMQDSKGLFSLPVGTGTRLGSDFEDTTPLVDAINNSIGLITPTSCEFGGPNYTPGATDTRSLRLTFDDGCVDAR